MIVVNDEIMKQEAFGDNTLKCVVPRFSNDTKDTVNIKWCYGIERIAELHNLG